MVVRVLGGLADSILPPNFTYSRPTRLTATIRPMKKNSLHNDRAGACHCRSVTFRVQSALDDVVICNCSFCVKRGALLQKMPAENFVLVSGRNVLREYGKRSFSRHFFCSRCGVHVFTRSTRNGEDAVIVNIACIEGVDPMDYAPRLFDGAALL